MSGLGIRVYGLAALALGAIGLVWDDFAAVWQPVPAGVPGRPVLALAVGGLLALSGAALLWPRTARAGAAALTTLFLVGVVCLHIPKVVSHPGVFVSWSGTAEQMALVAGGLIAFAVLPGLEAGTARLLLRIGWVAFGLCCLVFGGAHFAYEADTAAMVPRYLPLPPEFWARATGVAHIGAGLAILSGIRARFAAELLTIMFVCFAAMVHAPLLIAHPTSHLDWVMNAMNLALTGSAWIVADSLKGRAVWGP